MHGQSRTEPELNSLFRLARKHQGSEIYLRVGLPPIIRINDDLRQVGFELFSEKKIEQLLEPIMGPEQRLTLTQVGAVEFKFVLGKNEIQSRLKVVKMGSRLSFSALLLAEG
jgi:twitching motility protein PilT